MTTPQGGLQCCFVSEDALDPALKCTICHLVMRKPNLTSCCGAHFCEVCISHVRRGNGFSRACPLCRESRFTIMIDQNLHRKILQLPVYCDNKSLGCRWKGTVKSLESHMSIGKGVGDCQYQEVNCPLQCEESVLRKNVASHTKEECQNRPFNCPHCSHLATYREISSNHYSTCMHYPLLCPNRCTQDTILRCNMSDHLGSCPLQVVPCPYADLGCKVEVVQLNCDEHIEDNFHQHLELLRASSVGLKDEFGVVAVRVSKSTERLEKDLDQFKNSMLASMRSLQAEVKGLQKQLQQCQSDNASLKRELQQMQSEGQQSNPAQPQGSTVPPSSGNAMPMRDFFRTRIQAQTSPVFPLGRQQNCPSSQTTQTEPLTLPASVELVFGCLSDVEADVIVLPVNPSRPQYSGAAAVKINELSRGALFSYLSSKGSRLLEGRVHNWPVREEWGLHCKHILLLPRSRTTEIDTLRRSCTDALNKAISFNATSIAFSLLSPHRPRAEVARTMIRCFSVFNSRNQGHLSIIVVVEQSNTVVIEAFTNLRYWTV